MTTAFLDGWHAHRFGADIAINPYSETMQNASFLAWENGWCDRFNAIKHDLPLEYDEITG